MKVFLCCLRCRRKVIVPRREEGSFENAYSLPGQKKILLRHLGGKLLIRHKENVIITSIAEPHFVSVKKNEDALSRFTQLHVIKRAVSCETLFLTTTQRVGSRVCDKFAIFIFVLLCEINRKGIVLYELIIILEIPTLSSAAVDVSR